MNILDKLPLKLKGSEIEGLEDCAGCVLHLAIHRTGIGNFISLYEYSDSFGFSAEFPENADVDTKASTIEGSLKKLLRFIELNPKASGVDSNDRSTRSDRK